MPEQLLRPWKWTGGLASLGMRLTHGSGNLVSLGFQILSPSVPLHYLGRFFWNRPISAGAEKPGLCPRLGNPGENNPLEEEGQETNLGPPTSPLLPTPEFCLEASAHTWRLLFCEQGRPFLGVF